MSCVPVEHWNISTEIKKNNKPWLAVLLCLCQRVYCYCFSATYTSRQDRQAQIKQRKWDWDRTDWTLEGSVTKKAVTETYLKRAERGRTKSINVPNKWRWWMPSLWLSLDLISFWILFPREDKWRRQTLWQRVRRGNKKVGSGRRREMKPIDSDYVHWKSQEEEASFPDPV